MTRATMVIYIVQSINGSGDWSYGPATLMLCMQYPDEPGFATAAEAEVAARADSTIPANATFVVVQS